MEMSSDLKMQLEHLEELFTVPTDLLHKISDHWVKELEKGLTVEGGDIPMNPTWCMAAPTSHETGTFLAIDMGGTNLRICEVTLTAEPGAFDIVQSKYRMPEELKRGSAQELWTYIADCLHMFIESHHAVGQLPKLPLGFTFSYPATQDAIDHGVLQRWTKGFDVADVEGHDVVPQFEEALKAKGLPIRTTALVNDTTGTLIASAYTDPKVKIGCIFGTGCNAAYMERCGSIPKIAHLGLDPDLPMAINCEWGAFDNAHKVLPRTHYDIIIDKESPRPGQQTFEKMVAGLYLGEIYRLVLLDLHENPDVEMFKGQNVTYLRQPYILDSSFLSAIEEDATPAHTALPPIFKTHLSLVPATTELPLLHRLAQLIGARAARLSACGIAAICKKMDWETCHVGADGSVFEKYPRFRERQAAALRELFAWGDGVEDRIVVKQAEDGSGVGAALIAALTLERVRRGVTAGVRDVQGMLAAVG